MSRSLACRLLAILAITLIAGVQAWADAAPVATDRSDPPLAAQGADPSDTTSDATDPSRLTEAQWQEGVAASNDPDLLERWRDAELARIDILRGEIAELSDRRATLLLTLAPQQPGVADATSPTPAPIPASGAAETASSSRPGGPPWQQLDRHIDQSTTALRHHEKRLQSLDSRIGHLLSTQLQTEVTQLQRASNDANLPPIIQTGYLENGLREAQSLLEQARQLTTERKAQLAYEQADAQIADVLSEARLRLQLDSTGRRAGSWLWSKRRSLEQPDLLHRHLADIRVQREQASITLIEASRNLRDSTRWTPPAPVPGTDQADPAIDPRPIIERQPQWRRSLVERRIASLQRQEQALTHRIETVESLWQIMDRQLLWIPSHAPLSWPRLKHVHIAFLHGVVLPPNPSTATQRWLSRLREHPLHTGLAVALVIGLFVLRRRAPERLTALAHAKKTVATDRYGHTVKALAWTVLAALPWPVMLWLIGRSLINADGWLASNLAMMQATQTLALLVFCFAFLWHASAGNGLFRAHLRWPDRRCDLLRQHLPIIAATLLPLYFIADVAIARNVSFMIDGQGVDTPARLALLALCGIGAVSSWRLMAADGLWRRRDGGEAHRWRVLSRLALTTVLAGCAVLTVLGYVYSAFVLVGALLASIGVAVVATVMHGLIARWFLLSERRLSQRRLQRAREDQAERTDHLPVIDDDLSLQAVNTQSRRLLGAATATLLALGLIWVWADVLQAFMRLDEVTLWHSVQAGPEGRPEQVPVSLMSLLLGIVALWLTFVAARNLPGLIEIGLLPYARLDAATRYAITSVARYAIVITGLLAGLSLLGLRWSQLQWLAAALTVGLGFGLQEIFANFVSGLILLFERPFRVGDIITVGDLSGRVTTIRTRATTILDADNKEIVVPNKTFITGQLINWTLSDTVTRITISIGIAQGSDLTRARELMLQAANDHVRVLSEPPPRCVLAGFGQLAFEFQLQAHVGAIADRTLVQDDLSTRISELLQAHGVKIAFLPRDRDPDQPEDMDHAGDPPEIPPPVPAQVPPAKT